ncbi:hypothetical protein ACFE04_031473 [Oxalis oulophora]
MKSVLPRSGSVPSLQSLNRTGSIKSSLHRHDSITGAVFSGSPRVSLHLDVNKSNLGGIRRAMSASDVHGSEKMKESLTGAGSRSFPSRIEEDDDDRDSVGMWSQSGIPLEKLGFFGGGWSNGHGGYNGGGGGAGGGYNKKNNMGDYYKEMLKSNPGDSLVLRNYAKYLHEVEGNMEKAEELYGRAILANPGDGEVLSLYGKLIWESQRDGDRAKSYFDQAVSASPDDCMVMGSYAQFMWETEEEEDEEDDVAVEIKLPCLPVMAAAL